MSPNNFVVHPGSMSLLSWNCRGLGNPQTVNALKKVIRLEDPGVVFLLETKSDVDWVIFVRDQCGFSESFIVPSDGLRGGLALFWKSEIRMGVRNSSLSYIDAVVEGDSLGCWQLTGFYGHPETNRRVESWSLLKSLRGSSRLPWLVVGDFNEIKFQSEKEGGAPRPNWQMARFNDSINFCGLKEVSFVGPSFTWLYQRRDGSQIRERLDRALASSDWHSLFPSAKLFHKSSSASDHNPLVLHFFPRQRRQRHKKLFRFESMWIKDARCEHVVSEAWREGLCMAFGHPILSCMEECRSRLERWNQTEYGHVGKKISQLQKRLESLELLPSSPKVIQELRETRVNLNCWLDREDAMWKQRSRLSWFRNGDHNTQFFHAKASARFQKNLI